MIVCEVCEKEVCDDEWACRVEMNRREGCPELTPNNLPIHCIRADGTMLEHEHGDREDYLFPVEVEYIGPPDETRYHLINGEGNIEVIDEGWKYSIDHEMHALLYANGSIAVTMYETCSAAWLLQEDKQRKNGEWVVTSVAGKCLGGHLWLQGEWRLTDESLKKIVEYRKKKKENSHKNNRGLI